MAQFVLGDGISYDGKSLDSKAKSAAKILDKAQDALKDEDADEAISQGEKAVKEFRAAKYDDGVADALRVVIAGHRLSVEQGKRPEKAIEVAKEEKENFSGKNARNEACMMLSLAEINTDTRGSKHREEGIRLATDARNAFREANDRKMEAVASLALANLHSTTHDKLGSAKAAKDAMIAANEALTIFQELEDKRGEGQALAALGVARCQADTFQDGVKALKKGLEVFRELDDKKLVAFQLMSLAECSLRRGLPASRDALVFAEEGQSVLQDISYDKNGWPETALGLVVASHVAADDIDKAEEVVKAGLDSFKEGGNKRAEAVTLDSMISIHQRRGATDDALGCAEEALAIHKELENKRGEAYAQLTIASLQMRKGSSDGNSAAITAVGDAMTILKELKDTTGEAQAKVALCNALLAEKNNGDALDAANEALGIYREKGKKLGEAFAQLAVSAANLALDDREEALNAATEAQKIFEKEGDKNGEAYACQMIFEVQMANRGDPGKALAAVNKARQLRNKAGDKQGEMEMCLMAAQAIFAVTTQLAGKVKPKSDATMDKAVKASKEALAIARKMGDRESTMGCIFMLAQAQGCVFKYQDALKTVEEARMMASDAGDRKGEAIAACVVASIHFANGKTEKAKDFANQGLQLSRRAKSSDMENIANYLLDLFEPQMVSYGYAAYDGGFADPGADGGAASGGGPAEIAPYSGPTADDLRPKINELALSLLGTDDVASDTPLMDAGLDSLSMVQFRNQLAQNFQGVSMPASLIFDHPSASAVADYIAAELKDMHARGG